MSKKNVVQNNKNVVHNPRILWMSNAPWASTGYGQQTAQVVKRIKKDKYEIAIASNYGLEANNSTWNTPHGLVPVYSRGHDQYSNDVIPAHMFDWTQKDREAKNVLITLFDVWVFKGDKWDDWNIASWVPIDHLPVPLEVAKWCAKPNVSPIAMSLFGKKMLEDANIASYCIPHAIEKTYQPTHYLKDLNMTPREFMGIPEDAFVVGMNAANKGVYPCRKAFGENLLAFSIFAKNNPDAFLYLHTDASGSLGGIRLWELVKAVGIREDRVVFADPYLLRSGLSLEIMAGIYTGMDVLLATSYGEGFGVPTIEAQACGTPVIVSDFAASPELVGDGWKIGGQPLWDAPQRAFFHIPNVGEIVSALNESFARSRERSQTAINYVKQYDADFVYDNHWKPILKTILDKEPPNGSVHTRTN